MASSNAEKPAKKQVMDVQKPGKTPATASSRPIIVGHKPEVQDPMVSTAEDANPDAQEAPKPISPTPKKVIAPLTEAEKPESKDDSDKTEESPVSDEKSESEASTEDQADTQTEADNESQLDDTSSESVVVDAVADQVGNRKEKIDELSEEEKRKQLNLEKLVAEKKYFVPIGNHHKSNKIIWIVTGFLLLVLVGLLLAIDAEVLDAGFSLPIDLIK